MSDHPLLTRKQIDYIKKLLASGKFSRDEIAQKAKTSGGTVSKIKSGAPMRAAEDVETPSSEYADYQQAKSGSVAESQEITEDGWKISLPKTRICTLEQLVEHCQIDLEIWEVEKFICNKWEMGFVETSSTKTDGRSTKSEKARTVKTSGVVPLFQVKAFLRKKKAVANARAEIDALRLEALDYSPDFSRFTPAPVDNAEIAVEFSILDHHFGALIWGKETGEGDWDNGLALNAWQKAGAALMERTDSFYPSTAVITLGSDQQNADNRQGTTEKLTPQQMDGRYQKVYGISKLASRWFVDQALARYNRVHVVISPGNHDPLTAWHLGDYLATWYRNCPAFTIDNGPQQRKWWEWGRVMIMFEHGDKGKLEHYGKVMAAQKPEMWGRTKIHEAHTGHIHHKQTIEDMGFIVRSLPSLRPACSWSAENHHLGATRAAEAFVWSKMEGLIGQANYSILRDDEI